MTHICGGNLTIIGPDNGLSPRRHQAIIWTNAEILIGPLWTKFSEILTEILRVSFKKMRWKGSSAKWRPFCPGLNVLMLDLIIPLYSLKTWYNTHQNYIYMKNIKELHRWGWHSSSQLTTTVDILDKHFLLWWGFQGLFTRVLSGHQSNIPDNFSSLHLSGLNPKCTWVMRWQILCVYPSVIQRFITHLYHLIPIFFSITIPFVASHEYHSRGITVKPLI